MVLRGPCSLEKKKKPCPTQQAYDLLGLQSYKRCLNNTEQETPPISSSKEALFFGGGGQGPRGKSQVGRWATRAPGIRPCASIPHRQAQTAGSCVPSVPAHEDVCMILGQAPGVPTGWAGPRDLAELSPEKTGLWFLNSHLWLGAQKALGCGRAWLPGQEGLGRSRMPKAGSLTRFPHHHLSPARAMRTLRIAQGPARQLQMKIREGAARMSPNSSDDSAPPSVGATASPGGDCPLQSPSRGSCCSHAPPTMLSGQGCVAEPAKMPHGPQMMAQAETSLGRSRSREPPA